jgi:hypothetical protein
VIVTLEFEFEFSFSYDCACTFDGWIGGIKFNNSVFCKKGHNTRGLELPGFRFLSLKVVDGVIKWQNLTLNSVNRQVKLKLNESKIFKKLNCRISAISLYLLKLKQFN